LKPYYIVGDYFLPLFHSLVDINLILMYRQLAHPSLSFFSSLSKEKLSKGSEVAAMLSYFKNAHTFEQELSSGLE